MNRTETYYKNYREIIIDYIEYHKEELKDYFTDDEESNPHSSLTIKTKIQKLNEYIENAKKDGFHAGFMEIKAAALLLNMRIVIYRLNLSFMYQLIADFNNEIFQTENYIIFHYINNIHFELLYGKDSSIKNEINHISIGKDM